MERQGKLEQLEKDVDLAAQRVNAAVIAGTFENVSLAFKNYTLKLRGYLNTPLSQRDYRHH